MDYNMVLYIGDMLFWEADWAKYAGLPKHPGIKQKKTVLDDETTL